MSDVGYRGLKRTLAATAASLSLGEREDTAHATFVASALASDEAQQDGVAKSPCVVREPSPIRGDISVSTILITGASRGIGLQLCTMLIARGEDVIAVCRTPSAELEELGVRIIDGIDVSDAKSIERLKREIGDQPLDVIINNAGIMGSDAFGSLDYGAILDQFAVNALGPLRVTEALAENLHEGSKVAIVTSRMGSIGDNGSGGRYGYRASKTAVNQIGTNLRHELMPRGVAVVLLHPGMVATDLTGGSGIPPAEAARGLIERIDALDLQNSGAFWHAEGYELPW
jgi:NAD(P)-dependent dehydrogenase (short-subunit alcohol dehydrogenase family)